MHGEVNAPLLTPEKALKLDFSGSHVSMQACVSGLAKEGIGGDALGLEWALLQAGAQSLLATHWDVTAAASADFSFRFYQKWLVHKTSRAEAWRETALELLQNQCEDDKPKQYCWAGFSLAGDWR
jgi:CHAT domain-containing protein